MTTSGTTSFNLDLNNLVEEAFERCGVELRTGYDLRTARRSLNLLTIEWANRGINLWTIEQGTIPMVQGQIKYSLPVDTIDLLEHVVRTQTGQGQTDITINRISVDTYATIPNKNAQGRPIQVWINRQSGATYPVGGQPDGTDDVTGIDYPSINVWPAPDQDDYYTFVYWRLRRLQDAGDGTTTQDIPFRLLPALVAGLAFHLSAKLPGGMERMQMLKMMYDEQWQLAQDEDREKAPLRIAPRQYFR
tara:strand:+ start:813 stop:1553 length:741 start_codon:yes stop_codon:yes gene_type:complete